MCNIIRDEPILDNLNFFQSDKQEEDNVESTMINPDLLDLDLEDGDHVNNALVASATVYFLLITYNNITSKSTILWNIFTIEWRLTAPF